MNERIMKLILLVHPIFLYFPIFSYIFLYFPIFLYNIFLDIFSYIFLYKSTRARCSLLAARCSLLAARHCIRLQRGNVGTELGHATRRRQSDHATSCPSVCSMQASPMLGVNNKENRLLQRSVSGRYNPRIKV